MTIKLHYSYCLFSFINLSQRNQDSVLLAWSNQGLSVTEYNL